jgi:PadR family transcriptional regulator PadR
VKGLNVQYKKGVIELCVLALLKRQDRYGYDISELISRRIDISDGTVYPILRKLKGDGYVTTYLSEGSGGPPRKYYKMTELGKEVFQSDKAQWLDFIEAVKKMLLEEDVDDDQE